MLRGVRRGNKLVCHFVSDHLDLAHEEGRTEIRKSVFMAGASSRPSQICGIAGIWRVRPRPVRRRFASIGSCLLLDEKNEVLSQ